MSNVATDRERGYSLVEVVVALAIGLLVVSSAFVFLEGGREALAREPQVAEMNANVRSALARVSTVSLRNQLGQASMWPSEAAAVGWN